MAGKRTRSKSKKNSILNFVAVVVLTVLGLVLSFGSFDIPFTVYHYNGFYNSISLGLDLAGGVSVVYECEDGASDNAIDATVTRLTNILGQEYSEVTVTRQGGNKIRIEVPSVTDTNEILKKIGEPKPLHMTLEENKYVEGESISGSDIEDVQVGYQDGKYGVSVKFTSNGAKKFSALTKDASDSNEISIHVYLGEVASANKFQTLSCKTHITNGSTFISGSFESYEDANNYCMQIMSGTFSAQLKVSELSVVSATLGAKALKYCLIGGLVGLILIMFVLWLRYGDFGLLASFALVIYIILMLFFLQAISFVQLTLPGLAGIVLSIGMAVDGTVIIFERFREEYRAGKKIPLSVKSGFKRAFWPIFDSNITTIFTAIVLYILGTASIQGFAITLLIGIVLSLFMNLVILRFLVKWYLPFNSVKGKKLHLPKQTKHFKESDEVAEIESRVGGQASEQI